MSNIPTLRFGEFTSAGSAQGEGEWSEKSIQNILKIGSGKDYKHLKKGDIPVYGTGGYMTSVDEYLFDGESVCIGRKGTIDKPVLISGKFWTVDTLFYTHSFIDTIPKFVYALFQNINWKKYNEASGVPSLSKSTIEKIKISIPTKPEQKKIATFLSAVDSSIEQLSKKEQLLRAYKKGVMQKIFSREIRFPLRQAQGAVTEPAEVFEDWSEKRLGEILLNYRLGGNYANTETITNYPLIKMGNLNRGKINLHKIEYIKVNEKVKEIDKITIGDLFFNTRNTWDLVGKVAIWRNELPTAYYNSNLMYMKFDNNYFMNYRLNSYEGLKSLRSIATGTTSVAAIYTKDLLKITLLIPSLKEQTKIANFLSSLDKQIAQVSKQLEQKKVFKKGLLQQMFV